MGVNSEKAFPRAEWTEDHGDDAFAQDGMDLRDYFAAKAMQALASNGVLMNSIQKNLKVSPSDFPALLAKIAFEYADAMIEARKKAGAS